MAVIEQPPSSMVAVSEPSLPSFMIVAAPTSTNSPSDVFDIRVGAAYHLAP